MMENQVNEQTVTSQGNGAPTTGYKSGIWDGLSVVALIGGAIASVVLPANPAAGVIPVAAGVGLHLFNRKQLEQHLLANQQATAAQVVQLVNQNQAHLQEYLQKFQGDVQTSLGQQQQAIAANQANLTKTLQEQSVALQGELQAFQATAAQTHESLEHQHQDLVALVSELRTMEGCTQSIAGYPHAEAYYQRGLSHYRLEDWTEAVRDCTEAIRLRGDLAGAFHHRGMAYARLDNRKQATDDLRQAYKLYFDQGDLENYEIARALHKQYYEGPVADLELEAPPVTTPTDGVGHEAYIADPDREIKPLLAEESDTTAANLFG
ncbi:tetratricopeptide repeat protein [Synechocystis salina LEGE 06099]|uniref:slr0151 family photosystem II repair protein n=1 Tax=Synechocystis salina TaxID=945780 RepID=UPI0018801C38|nr:tetratricopeptide repeat protein [Synechocystis salina]MBE9202636.1 tetratricopeptide repeat protein [Synechocystis salina LEGE 06099]